MASLTQATSATLVARHAEIEAAEAAVSEARVALWPRLVAAASYARLSPVTAPTLGNVVMAPSSGAVDPNNLPAAVPLRFPVLLDSMGFQLGASIPASDYFLRFPHTVAASRRALSAAQAQGDVANNQTFTDARILYYAWARAVLQKEVADTAVEQARAHLALALSREGVGNSTSTDALRATSQFATAELLQLRLAHLTELLADQLRTSMHDSRTERYVVGETLDPTTASTTLDFTSCYEYALSHRAELSSLAAAIEGEREQAKAARAMMIPHLEFYGAILGSNPNPRYIPLEDRFHTTWEVGGRINYSPNELAVGQTQARQHRARAEALVAQHQQALEHIRDEVLAAVQAQQESALALAAAAKSLAAAEDSYRIRQSLFAEGRSASVELTDAETDLIRARFAQVDARIDARLASIRLDAAMGVMPNPRR